MIGVDTRLGIPGPGGGITGCIYFVETWVVWAHTFFEWNVSWPVVREGSLVLMGCFIVREIGFHWFAVS